MCKSLFSIKITLSIQLSLYLTYQTYESQKVCYTANFKMCEYYMKSWWPNANDLVRQVIKIMNYYTASLTISEL